VSAAKCTRKQIIRALEANQGFLSFTARALNLKYDTLKHRMARDPKLRAAWEAIRESHLDFGESKLLTAVKKGESWAVCFYLKCQGKKRGYVERPISADEEKAKTRDRLAELAHIIADGARDRDAPDGSGSPNG